ncbi:MAG: PAS domain S-box protein [Oscillospiraceae bacterium]|nr:PAS domain S-box protein [Oscillospiraceae bacterium]
MKRRIYLSFVGLVLSCVLVLSALLSLMFHNAARKREIDTVKDYANMVSGLLGSGMSGDFHFSDYISRNPDAPRMTVIAPDGTVLLDSRVVADRLENHAERPEVIQALQSGTGESLRYSDTLQTEMYYYAVTLSDGNVLRMSKPVKDMTYVLKMLLPATIGVTVLIILIANFAARGLTRRIIAPIEKIDFESENSAEYYELAPYMKKIDRQKRELDEKISALSDRAGTIEAITGNMKEALILIDDKGEALTANNSARDIFGEDMEHKSVLYICRDLDFQSKVRLCLSGENAEIRMERGGRVYNVFMSPVCSGGASRGAVILFQDVTERHQAEKQRREFSANVSHELKTPLTTISALSEMIESGIAKDGDVKCFAARISEQAGRLLVLIDDIIRLSEFDEGGVAKELTVFDLYELTETVMGSLQGNSKGIEILLTGERFDITANRRMIDELLYNLIDNGVKYNNDGGNVNIDLTRAEDGMCKISVSDTGIGISESHQPRVFERFYRVDRSRSKKTGGTGLGLSIVKHITEYHGGRIELQSAEGSGTTVTCYISG